MSLFVGGENLIDMVQIGTENSLPVYQAIPGGSPFNLALATAKQGIKTHYLTPISTDYSGDMLAARLQQAGANLVAERHRAPSSLAMVSLNDGLPTYSFYRNGTAERQVSLAHLQATQPTGGQLLHLGSLALSGGNDAQVWEDFAHHCKQQNMLFSLDPNVRASLIKDREGYLGRIKRLLAIADIVKLSDEDLLWLYDTEDIPAALDQLCNTCPAPVLVLTRGSEGSSVLHDQAWHDIPAHSVTDLQDTVGAGDTFMATMLAWLMDHRAIDDLYGLDKGQKLAMIRYASRAAAINCARQGCNPPSKAEMEG